MKGIAFFDFDGTLARGDTLWPFLVASVGPAKSICAFVRAVGAVCRGCSSCADRRTVFKQALLMATLAGRDPAQLPVAAFQCWPRWIPGTVKALKEHHARGHKIVIASGSLDLYLDALLEDLPVDDILCTRMEIVDGRLTGRMEGGNCVRAEKAARVERYLREHGPFTETWAYGNAPHDLPMLALVKNGVTV